MFILQMKLVHHLPREKIEVLEVDIAPQRK